MEPNTQPPFKDPLWFNRGLFSILALIALGFCNEFVLASRISSDGIIDGGRLLLLRLYDLFLVLILITLSIPKLLPKSPVRAAIAIRLWLILLIIIPPLSFISVTGELMMPHIPQVLAFSTLYLALTVLYALANQIGVRKFFVYALPALVLLGIIELSLRGFQLWGGSHDWQRRLNTSADLASNNPQSLYVPNHYTVYGLRPSLKLANGTVHNSQGLRDSRNLDTKDNNVVRIVFLGGSTVYEPGIANNEDTPTAILEELLNKELGERSEVKFEVINAGLSGAVSSENLLRAIFIISEISPDLVIIKHGYNDIHVRSNGDITSDFSNYRSSWHLPTFSQRSMPLSCIPGFVLTNWSALAQWALNVIGASQVPSIGDLTTNTNAPKVDPTTNSSHYFERNTGLLIAVLKSLGTQILIVSEAIGEPQDLKYSALYVPQHNAILKRIARHSGVEFFDYAQAVSVSQAIMPDGLHLNESGAKVAAKLYFDFLIAHPELIAAHAPQQIR